MPTKKERSKKLLKYIPEPSTIDIINIAEDVGCSERTVYRALKELRGNETAMSKHVKMIVGLYTMMALKFDSVEELTVKELRLIKEIESFLIEEKLIQL